MSTLLDRIRQLPPEIQDLLASEDVAEQNERILTASDVPFEREDAVLACIQSVYLKDRPVEALPACLREALPGWSADRLRPLARDCIGYRLLPMSGYLRGMREELVRLGGDAASYPGAAVAVFPRALADVIRDAAARAGVTITEPVAARRFEDAAATYLKGIRDRFETTDALTRGAKTGGVGLTPEQAERVLVAFDAARAAPVVEAAPVAPRSSDALALEAHEVEAVARAHPIAQPPRAAKLQAAVGRIISTIGRTFPTPELQRRFALAIETRLRDLRDEHETLDLLTRAVGAGGLGLPPAEAARMTEAMRRASGVTHQAPEGPAPTTPLLPSPPPVMQLAHPAPHVRSRQPEVSGSTAFIPAPSQSAPLPSSVPKRSPAPQPSSPPPAKPIAPSPSTPDPPPQMLNTECLTPPPPSRSSPPPRPMPVASPPPAPPHTPPATPLLPGPSTPPTADRRPPIVGVAGRPRIQDIRPVPPRLVGPVEELARLTIADFRRIAPSPDAAVQTIIEKLALLTRDGYAKRAEGIRALRTSVLMVAYGEIVNAALAEKRKVEDIVAERSVDHGALAPREFQALRSLNAQLRF